MIIIGGTAKEGSEQTIPLSETVADLGRLPLRGTQPPPHGSSSRGAEDVEPTLMILVLFCSDACPSFCVDYVIDIFPTEPPLSLNPT